MRKITENAVNAFIAGKNWSQGNTSVEVEMMESDTVKRVRMRLHGNLIAERYDHISGAFITHAGWPTVTTKERLNGILSRLEGEKYVYQKRGVWYIMQNDEQHGNRIGVEWEGDWIKV